MAFVMDLWKFARGHRGKWHDRALAALLVVDVLLTIGIFCKVEYTEIDHRAYMQEVEGFLQGERDYRKLRGDTGPLVYPAAFVYLWSALYKLTDGGHDIVTAQYMFMLFYVATVACVMALYRRAGRVPLYAYGLLILSKRLHSIFVLRLFNDGVAMLVAYLSMVFFCDNRFAAGAVLFSLAVGVKMNILLFAPGLLLVMLQARGSWLGAAKDIAICALVQLAIGFPFLSTHPVSYIAKAFEFSRVFMYKWTVNLRFLDEGAFVSKRLSLALLALHLLFLALFARKWVRARGTVAPALLGARPRRVSADYVLTTMLMSNFIGIAFARTLHYQFYSWYFHAVPFLATRARLPLPAVLAVFAALEYSFGYVFPATALSSLVLQAAHALLLLACYFYMPVPGVLDAGAKAKAP